MNFIDGQYYWFITQDEYNALSVMPEFASFLAVFSSSGVSMTQGGVKYWVAPATAFEAAHIDEFDIVDLLSNTDVTLGSGPFFSTTGIHLY